VVRNRWALVVAGIAVAAGVPPVAAQPYGPGIYTCVDARGRTITSDRPNMECLDREQRRYGAGGTVKERVAPSFTAEERAAAEEKARVAEEQRLREAERKRRDRVLLNRYPNQASHQSERDEALSRVDAATATGEKRVAELVQQREDLARDEKAAGADVVKLGRVRRAIDDNESNLAAQKRLLASQADERQRINKRFDEELGRLKPMWAQNAAAGLPARSASKPRS
jgi:hypothetical protein